MKISRYISLILPVIFFAACSRNPNPIIISGDIESKKSGHLFLLTYPDTFALYNEIKLGVNNAVIENGKFKFEIISKMPLVFNIEDGTSELATNFFICPGDELKVSFSGKENTASFGSGEAAKCNRFLTAFTDSFFRNPSVKEEYYISTNYMDGHTFEIYNDRRKEQQLSYFEKYFKGSELKDEYKNYILNTIQYGILIDRITYVWKKRMKGEKVTLDPDYYNFVRPEIIENRSAFMNPVYIHFLNLYIDNVYASKLDSGEIKPKEGSFVNPAVEKFRLAQSLLKRPFRDAVMFRIIRDDNIDRNGFTSVDSMEVLFRNKYSLN